MPRHPREGRGMYLGVPAHRQRLQRCRSRRGCHVNLPLFLRGNRLLFLNWTKESGDDGGPWPPLTVPVPLTDLGATERSTVALNVPPCALLAMLSRVSVSALSRGRSLPSATNPRRGIWRKF
eukprot:404183-Pyramimonas_sp.AAC.1